MLLEECVLLWILYTRIHALLILSPIFYGILLSNHHCEAIGSDYTAHCAISYCGLQTCIVLTEKKVYFKCSAVQCMVTSLCTNESFWSVVIKNRHYGIVIPLFVLLLWPSFCKISCKMRFLILCVINEDNICFLLGLAARANTIGADDPQFIFFNIYAFLTRLFYEKVPAATQCLLLFFFLCPCIDRSGHIAFALFVCLFVHKNISHWP